MLTAGLQSQRGSHSVYFEFLNRSKAIFPISLREKRRPLWLPVDFSDTVEIFYILGYFAEFLVAMGT